MPTQADRLSELKPLNLTVDTHAIVLKAGIGVVYVQIKTFQNYKQIIVW